MPADNAAAPAPDANGATQQGTDAVVANPFGNTTNEDLMRAAGLPEEVVRQVAGPPKTETKAEAKAEATTETVERPETPITEEADEDEGPPAETEPEEGEETEPAETEDDTEPEGEQRPNWYQKRLQKWTRQKERFTDTIEELQERLAKLEANGSKPAAQQVPDASPDDPLPTVNDLETLNRVVEGQRRLREWCRLNREGTVENEGTDKERVISEKEVAAWLNGAERLIEELAPKKFAQLQNRAARQNLEVEFEKMAKAEYASLYDQKSDDYKASLNVLQMIPEIANHPAKNFLMGVLLEGYRTRNARLEAAAANGKNGDALPEALRRKIPPIPRQSAPNVPRGSRESMPANKKVAAAKERLISEGGSRDAAVAWLRERDAAAALSSGKGRAPAPV